MRRSCRPQASARNWCGCRSASNPRQISSTISARRFAHHGYSVLAPDLPGHGRSAGKPIPTIADMADWTDALLDAAGAPSAKLVGHSMGSLIALETSARHPDKVSGLSLIGTAATMTV